jgi:type VI secretion system secreted protein VgrG
MDVRRGFVAGITIAGTEYAVRRFTLVEGIFEVGSLRCSLVDDMKRAPDPASLLDADAVFTIKTIGGDLHRAYVGKVVHASRAERDAEVVVVPKAWRLSKRADCRTFQHMSATDIVKKVLTGAGVDKTTWKLSGSYAPRDYTVQYRETDLAFVSRLLSEEGIYFAIRHDDAANTMVFSDDPKGIDDAAGTKNFAFHEGTGSTHGMVFDVEQVQSVRSDKTMLRDYNADKPKLKLESTAKTDKASAEVYVWPGRFDAAKAGDHYAQVLLDSLRADRDVVSGQTTDLSLVPGARFSIEGHPYHPLNQEYVVVGAWLLGRADEKGQEGGAGTEVHFRAIPTKVPLRPPRLERQAYVAGVQTAVTTGPGGQEIHTDAHGHVKAQFHWDRLGKNDDTSSVWMRTSQLPTGGSMLLPRMKWEVAVRYMEGDPDRPVVMSRMYNAATPPPYKLPDHKASSSIQTATTPGGGSSNEIRTCDTKGSEEMMMNASKDMSVDVGNDTTEKIGANLTRNIGSNADLDVTNSLSSSVGGDQKVKVGAKQNISVQTFMVDQVGGDFSLDVGAMRSMKVGGDHKRDVGGDSKLKVGSLNIDLVVGSANEHALGNYDHHVSAALVEMTAGGRSIVVGGDRKETATLAKVLYSAAGRSVDVTTSMTSKVAGLVYRKTDGDLAETGTGGVTEVATGAQLLKATNISIEGTSKVTLVMGASVLSVMDGMVSLAGLSVKIDGETVDEGALVIYL